MLVEQIAVFVENKPGRLAAITKILADDNINIRALSVADTADFGILRLIVDDPQKAAKSLQDGGFTIVVTEVVAIEVEDRTGGLATVLAHLADAGVSVEYMYAFVNRSGENAIIISRFEHMENAVKVLEGTGVKLVSKEQVYNM
jgi:hypothetical protein